MGYKHHGVDVCRKTLYLHGIGKDRLQSIKDHYKEEGLQAYITKCSPYHAMPFDATSYFQRTTLKKMPF